MREGHTYRELPAQELGPPIRSADLGFRTTEELPRLTDFVGQPRALTALKAAVGIRQPGYHVFAAGISGTGKMDLIQRTLQERASHEPAPDDWVYVNNFDESDQPLAIAMKVGNAARLKQDMASLIGRLMEELPKAFQREDFGREKDRLRKHYRQQGESLLEELNRIARERSQIVQQLDDGRVMFVPLKDGKPISQEEGEKLSPEELARIEQSQQEVLDAARSVFQRQQDLERQLNADVRQVERAFADQLIAPLLGEIAMRYQNERLSKWLDRLKAHFLLNLDRFQRRADRMLQQVEPLIGEPILADLQERFFEYQVNLLVDHGAQKQAPVIVEGAPTYRNIFGTIERVVDRYGRVVTNFTRIKAGSLLKANGGYLVFDLLDALAEPFVWKELKRTLKRGSAEIEIYDPFSLFTISGLKPEPIPLNIKLVVVGHPLLYYLLYHYDDEFREIFRFKADFDTEFSGDENAGRIYGGLVEKLRQQEKFPPFDADAVATLIRASSRFAEHKAKLTAVFSRICDLIREAAFWASEESASTVSGCHVENALAQQIYRSDLIAAKIREFIREGTLLVSLEQTSVGQVNGLAVADLGDYVFGWPTRITASVGLGTAGIVNIERESRLSGKTYDKGILILDGFLRNTYAHDYPLSLCASLAMEQSYGGVDGDSASVAELLCLLSAIAGIPLRQDIAVTGSVNQRGQIQPIGAVNEKIEGFFDVCREFGLSGTQGVCIPEPNVKNLILRPDVIAAVERGEFHVWAIKHIDEGIELLSGLPAGMIDDRNSFHGRVESRNREMAQRLKAEKAEPKEGRMLAVEQAPEPFRDPRPPPPGRP
jgi:predicted ATP-dependent protease